MSRILTILSLLYSLEGIGYCQSPGDKETVFEGKDNRILINNTENHPWSYICRVESIWEDGTKAFGTGTLVGKHHVLTAAHVLFDKKLGQAKWVYVMPGYNKGEMPYGRIHVKYPIRYKKYETEYPSEADITMLILDKDIGDTTAWMGMATYSDDGIKEITANLGGYPSDKKAGELWYTYGTVSTVEGEDQLLAHQLPTSPGVSGAGLYTKENKGNGNIQRYLFAIHIEGGRNKNYAVRLTKTLYDDLVKWKNEN